MRICVTSPAKKEILAAQQAGLERYRSIPITKPASPVKVGLTGEYFTAVNEESNLGVEKKLLRMGVEVHRMLNMTNRNLRYNEKNLRAVPPTTSPTTWGQRQALPLRQRSSIRKRGLTA